MDRFWVLLEQSTLFSGVIALSMVFTAMYCVVNQIPLPDYFSLPLGVIIGYFFSEKVRSGKEKRATAREG